MGVSMETLGPSLVMFQEKIEPLNVAGLVDDTGAQVLIDTRAFVFFIL
jgi:hypothetical protein